MNIEEKKYRNKITYTSFVLALLVVWLHAYNVDVYGLENGGVWLAETWLHRVMELAVPTFFTISGYLFYVNFDYSRLLPKFKSRLASILIPYLIWNEIGFLYYQLITIVPAVRNSLNNSLEPLTLQSVIAEAVFGYHNITWFLRYLMLFIIVTPLLFPLLKHKKSVVILPIVFILGIWTSYASCWFYYLAGAYLAIHHSDLVQNRTFSKREIIIAAIGLAVTSALNIYNPYEFISRILLVIGIVCLWIVMDIFRTEKDPAWWARLSFYIYLSHRMILESVEKVFLIVFGVSTWAAVFDYIVAPIITMVILFVGAFVLQKMPHLWKVLNGGR